MIISCDTSQQSELRVRLSTTTSASSSSSPKSSRSNSRRFIHAVEDVADCSSSNSSSSGHSRDDDDLDAMGEGKGHPHYSHQAAGSTLSDLIRSMHIVLIWAVAKSKMRHILGLYTFMITIMLHFSSSSINNIQSIVEKGSHGMSTTSIRYHHQQQQQPSV
jgi:hypothetical protein